MAVVMDTEVVVIDMVIEESEITAEMIAAIETEEETATETATETVAVTATVTVVTVTEMAIARNEIDRHHHMTPQREESLPDGIRSPRPCPSLLRSFPLVYVTHWYFAPMPRVFSMLNSHLCCYLTFSDPIHE